MLHRCNVREWEWEGMGIDCTGMGGSGNVKSHSRASLTRTDKRTDIITISSTRLALRVVARKMV